MAAIVRLSAEDATGLLRKHPTATSVTLRDAERRPGHFVYAEVCGSDGKTIAEYTSRQRFFKDSLDRAVQRATDYGETDVVFVELDPVHGARGDRPKPSTCWW